MQNKAKMDGDTVVILCIIWQETVHINIYKTPDVTGRCGSSYPRSKSVGSRLHPTNGRFRMHGDHTYFCYQILSTDRPMLSEARDIGGGVGWRGGEMELDVL